MNRPQYILLPANRAFIVLSLVVALVLNVMPWGQWMGVPDFVALVLVFWNIHQPRKLGIVPAFFMGLLMDVHDATLLGQHALAYTILSYFAIMIHRRVLWFSLPVQSLHVLLLLAVAQAVQWIVRLAISSKMPGWWYLSESLVAAVLWPLLTVLLLAPQRRAIDRDENRPI